MVSNWTENLCLLSRPSTESVLGVGVFTICENALAKLTVQVIWYKKKWVSMLWWPLCSITKTWMEQLEQVFSFYFILPKKLVSNDKESQCCIFVYCQCINAMQGDKIKNWKNSCGVHLNYVHLQHLNARGETVSTNINAVLLMEWHGTLWPEFDQINVPHQKQEEWRCLLLYAAYSGVRDKCSFRRTLEKGYYCFSRYLNKMAAKKLIT